MIFKSFENVAELYKGQWDAWERDLFMRFQKSPINEQDVSDLIKGYGVSLNFRRRDKAILKTANEFSPFVPLINNASVADLGEFIQAVLSISVQLKSLRITENSDDETETEFGDKDLDGTSSPLYQHTEAKPFTAKGGLPVSATSKLLSFRHPDHAIIYDNVAKKVMKFLRHTHPPKECEGRYKSQSKNSKVQNLLAYCATFEYFLEWFDKPLSAAIYLMPDDSRSTAGKKRRLLDFWLYTNGKLFSVPRGHTHPWGKAIKFELDI